MKKVDLYIEKIFRNFDPKDEETEVLKEETKAHIMEEIQELKLQGLSEEESIEIAINKFGEKGQVEKELAEIFKVQRKFASVILLTALLSLIFSAMCFIGYKIADKNFSLKVPSSLETAVSGKLEAGEMISNEEVNQLLTKYKKQFRYVAVYKGKNLASPDKIYPASIPVEEVRNDYASYLTKSINAQNGTSWEVRYGFDIRGFRLTIASALFIATIVLFVIYWLLFGFWCVINTYHNDRLSLAWIVLFFSLNVAAYIIFLFDRCNSLKTEIS